MKIYTKTGDDGTTGLIGGERVRKCDRRIECYGTVDELNAALGLSAVIADPSMQLELNQVQNDLFVIGSHLATPTEDQCAALLPDLDDAMVHRLEMQIDSAETALPPLRQFILPGGCELAARLHMSRTICRRAERLLVDFSLDRPVPALILTYLNRLSDWLFVQARRANHLSGRGRNPVEKGLAMSEPRLRFAVLLHSGVDEPHYDLMFETRPGSDLATWRSQVWPIQSAVELKRLRDHRRIYLDYQGELSLSRGNVTRIAEGFCDLAIEENSIWTIRLDIGAVLELTPVSAERWTAHPLS